MSQEREAAPFIKVFIIHSIHTYTAFNWLIPLILEHPETTHRYRAQRPFAHLIAD